MIKKLFSFICCLLPVGAGAVVVEPQYGNLVSTEQTDWKNAVADSDSLVINGQNVIGIESPNGFAVNNMVVGATSTQGILPLDLYVMDTVPDNFTVLAGGNVSVNAMLSVLGGKSFAFKSSDTNPVDFDLTLGAVTVGAEGDSVAASLVAESVDSFVVNGNVVSYGDVKVSANSVDMGAADVYDGDFAVSATGDVAVGGLVATMADSVSVESGANIVVDGGVQNNIASGQMNLKAMGNVTVTGALENKSSNGMTINAGLLNVAGTMINDYAGAELVLNLSGWTVSGGDVNNASFVNVGDLYATVSGQTKFEYGIDITDMGIDNVFSLDTGTLVFGENVSQEILFGLFSNGLNDFNLAVRDGDLNVGVVFNGDDSNNAANMNVLAKNVSATTVNNAGDSLVIKAADLDSGYDVSDVAANDTVGNLSVSGQVVGAQNSDTKLIASGNLEIDGAVSNDGKMLLNANSVSLASIANTGFASSLEIKSLLDATGLINISGNIVNTNGMVSISAKDVSVGGEIINNGGVLTLLGSDSNGGAVQLQALDIQAGQVDLNALAGAVTFSGALTVAGGNLSLGSSLYDLTVNNAPVQILGSLVSGQQAAGQGNVTVAATGTQDFVLGGMSISVGKDVVVGDGIAVRNVVLDSGLIDVNQNVVVHGNGHLTIGKTSGATVDVEEQVIVENNAVLEIYSDNFVAGSLIVDGKMLSHGTGVTIDNGDVEIAGNIYFNGETANTGLTIDVDDVDTWTLKTSQDLSSISVGAIAIADDKKLNVDSAGALTVGGIIDNAGDISLTAADDVTVTGKIQNTAALNVSGANVSLNGIDNSGDVQVVIAANNGDAIVGDVNNSGSALEFVATDKIVAGAVSNSVDGVLAFDSDLLEAQSIIANGNVGSQININADVVAVSGNVRVAGNLNQGDSAGMLNLQATDLSAGNLFIDDSLVASAGNATYDIGTNIEIANMLSVAQGAITNIYAGNLINADAAVIENFGTLNLSALRGLTFASAVNNAGVLSIDSGTGVLDLGQLTINSGNVVLAGSGAFIDDGINTGAMLYQNWGTTLQSKDVNINANNYVLTTGALDVKGINQDGALVINTSDISVGSAGINATDLRFVAQKNDDGDTVWQNVNIMGNVSGNVDFIGLEKMNVSGSYLFNNGSSINAAILPYADGVTLNTTDINYWATISLLDDGAFGKIVNPTGDDARPLISVDGEFEADITLVGGAGGDALLDAQIGIDIFDVVDAGTAIWFLQADQGIAELGTKIRNLNVRFCNADGTLCYNYFDSLTNVGSTDSDDLPAYITAIDSDSDFTLDSLYIVFDPSFGGPIEVFKIQPIVAKQDNYTYAEYVSAGAIDDMLAGKLNDKKFNNRTPIEVIPLVFKGTNLSRVGTELYNRMEYYSANRDGELFVPFSRLFQVRELEQIAGSLALNEHTAFRSFEDRMLDEFIWNRGRKLKKAWLDVDYGMYSQDLVDSKRIDGNRFSIIGGFDWQATNTLMLGLTGRISHNSSDFSDSMDLSYGMVQEAGFVDISVSDTNIGLGAYLMETVNEKARIYGNAFLDIHVFDIKRNQNFVAPIDGSGSAFSLISEWGLMHDLLNQYIVGNLYARAGYNFGFDITEKAAGADYMNLKSDGYFIFTPGYSLTAQKRIYPSAWFQIRPYASIGIEYDVLGMPDNTKYKFAVADKYTYYDIETNPFWANIGAGVEFVVANGVQMGVDYRYQYNSAIQLHNIKFSGSYRF